MNELLATTFHPYNQSWLYIQHAGRVVFTCSPAETVKYFVKHMGFENCSELFGMPNHENHTYELRPVN